MTCRLWNHCIYSVLFISLATWGLLNDEIGSRSVAPGRLYCSRGVHRISMIIRRAAGGPCVCENGGGFGLSASSLTPCQGWRSGPHSVLSAFVMLMKGVNASRSSDSPRSPPSFSPSVRSLISSSVLYTPQREISVFLHRFFIGVDGSTRNLSIPQMVLEKSSRF